MKAIRTKLSLLALAAMCLSMTAVATPQSAPDNENDRDGDRDAWRQRDKDMDKDEDKNKDKAEAKVGEEAPEFTLKDTSGKAWSLSDFEDKMVILEWINPDCPVCRRVMKTDIVRDTIKEVREMNSDAVYLAVNSTHYMDAEDSAKYLKKHKMDIPALVDSDGKVGKLYGARTTPHMYVIDSEGVLRYSGAMDNDTNGRKANAGGEVTNYVVNAVRQIEKGETVSPDKTRPYGCSVKYKKK